ncbi:hypothetical protein [Bradyrhizobium sp. CCGE-LA001]|uniref:hypothetical protein n=1 Tax=Bradyrhizobium sp. CCGE-LA001 TaxID=1223566 RepID=UPI0011982866|nr:hypothetical protein [Bradyrhizobium sp. CCGE-LA001]
MSALLARTAALLAQGRGPARRRRICKASGNGFAKRIQSQAAIKTASRPTAVLTTLSTLLLLSLASMSFAAPGEWSDFATVSMTDPETPKLTNNGICWSDGTNILCDGTAGLASGGGTVADKDHLRHDARDR